MSNHFEIIALNSKRFKRLTYTVSAYYISLFGFFLISKNQDMAMVFLGLFFIFHLTFIYYIGDLAAAAKRSTMLWVFGSLFSVVGPFVAYFRMRVIAVTNGWA